MTAINDPALLPQASGSYMVIDGELILDQATQPPSDSNSNGIPKAADSDGQSGDDVQHVVKSDRD